jgi:dienelactone hydrolase
MGGGGGSRATGAAGMGMQGSGGAAGGGAGGMMAASGAGESAAGAGGAQGHDAGDGPDNDDPCTPSMVASANAAGTGPHKVVVESNADPGIDEGTIFRPEDLGGAERYPIFVWGEGGCAQQGLSNQSANAEIASHGYFVIADGTVSGGAGNRSLGGTDAGKPMIAYIDWAIAENSKPCSAYYHSLDTKKIATNGFSCGGLMAEGTASDPRLTTWMINSSGAFAADQALYDATHGPVLIVLGGSSDIAYENGKRDYDNLAKLTYPLMLFSKDLGHGGDLFAPNGGDFTRLNLAWLNWWLKGDESATGKGFLTGDGCTLCKDSAWETASMNVP